jgi:import inner membrane translocase subunit TIM44
MEEQALRLCSAQMKEREAAGITLDDRILDVANVDISQAKVINDVPIVIVTFSCQHVNCAKNKKGEIVKGGSAEIQTSYYVWAMRRDLYSEDFDWKIVEMQTHVVFALV